MSLGQSRRGARLSAKRKAAGGGSPAYRTSARGNDEATGNNSTSVITVPGTVAANDVMLVVAIQNTGTSTQTISSTGGATWTKRQGPNTFSSNNGRANLWTARATGSSAGATITVSSDESKRFPSLLLVCSGVTDTGIVSAVTVNGSSDISSHVWPSVTVPSPGGFLLVAFSAVKSASDIVPTFSGGVPSGMTLDDESNTAAPSSPNFTVSGFHKATTVATGSQSPGTGTSKNAGDGTTYSVKSVLYSVALAPA